TAAQLRHAVGKGGHHRLHPLERLFEILRAGALEAEDRLLVVADDEDRADAAAMRALAAEEIVDQREDDVPLRAVGVLRLVDQYVIEAPVELVADPIGNALAGQQAGREADLVVEIDQPFALLRI